MNESYKTARILAQKLLAEAQENEPNITKDLQTIAREVSAEMVGLENRFKREESLTRKLFDTANTNLQTLREVAEIINDALRYTFVLPFETYAREFQRTIKILESAGYQVPKSRIWNAWKYIGKKRDKGYRGINITVISSKKQIFELQFHTAESFRLKTETHNLYKELRSRAVSEKREVELISEMKKSAVYLERPEGV